MKERHKTTKENNYIPKKKINKKSLKKSQQKREALRKQEKYFIQAYLLVGLERKHKKRGNNYIHKEDTMKNGAVFGWETTPEKG